MPARGWKKATCKRGHTQNATTRDARGNCLACRPLKDQRYRLRVKVRLMRRIATASTHRIVRKLILVP